MIKKDIIKKRLKQGLLPFLAQKISDKGELYLDVEKQALELGFVGLNEMLKAHTGEELHEGNAWAFGLKTIQRMREIGDEFSKETGLHFAVSRTPAESCAYRLAQIDLKEFNGKAIVQGDVNKKSVYYTNGAHVRPSVDISLLKRMKIESAFHPILSGGTMSHVWLGEDNPDVEALHELTKKIVKKTLMSYFAYTKDLTICKKCKHTAQGILKLCPKCDSKDIDWYSRVTGYMQRVSSWNAGKIQEFKDRHRYGLK